MTKGKLPEVRAVIEFDRLATYHLTDAYALLVPTPKRLIRRAPVKKQLENQPVIENAAKEREMA